MSPSSPSTNGEHPANKPFPISLLRAKAKGSADGEACMVLKEFKAGLVRVFLQAPSTGKETLVIEVIVRPCVGEKSFEVSDLEARVGLARELERLGYALTEEDGYLEGEKTVSPTTLESESSSLLSAIAKQCKE